MKSMRTRIILGLLLLVGLGTLLIPSRFGPPFDPNKKPDLGDQNPAAVDLFVRGEATTRLTNPDKLLSLLRSGRPVRQHRSTYTGRLTLHFGDGSVSQVILRPGRLNALYEFSCTNGLFAVPRPEFLATLASAGADTNRIPVK